MLDQNESEEEKKEGLNLEGNFRPSFEGLENDLRFPREISPNLREEIKQQIA